MRRVCRRPDNLAGRRTNSLMAGPTRCKRWDARRPPFAIAIREVNPLACRPWAHHQRPRGSAEKRVPAKVAALWNMQRPVA